MFVISQIKGFMIGFVFFMGLAIPTLLMFAIDSINQNAFMKMTGELAEVVKSEGGVTAEVNQIVSGFSNRGYTISFVDKRGAAVNGQSFFGDEITIHYEYRYKNTQGEKVLRTTNNAVILRR